jgi:hypothetical protein
MAVYAIAQLTITDRTTYDRYQQRFMGVMKRFKGKVLAADENPQVVEGAWDRQKVVLLFFPGDCEGPEGRIGCGDRAGEGDRVSRDCQNRRNPTPASQIGLAGDPGIAKIEN